MSLIATIIPALLPVAADGVRAVFSKITGGKGAQPANVAEVIQLMNADTDRLKTLAQLDATGTVHTWVNDVRALQRPLLSMAIITGYIGAVWFSVDVKPDTLALLGEYAQMVTFYLFGDRTYMAFKGGKR